MKSFTITLSLLFLTVIFISCGEDSDASKQSKKNPQTVSVIEVPTKTVTTYTSYPTSIEGIINSDVRAKIPGYISKVYIDEGAKVSKGQRLFSLETQSLNQDAAAAKATINAAQVEVDKLRPLVEKNIISNVRLETAKAQLTQAQSAYNSILANVNYGTITSPVDGYVGAIRLREGALVSPTSAASLTTVSDISKVYAYFSMNESDYIDFIQNAETSIDSRIDGLPKVRLVLANGSTYDEAGTIETINSQVDRQTGAVSFRAIFDNPSRIITNGSSGRIRLPKTYKNALVVPKTSTYEQQGSTYVYKIGNDSTAVAYRLTILDDIENIYVVSDGVQKGDLIVAEGVATLNVSEKLTSKKIPFDSIAKPIKKSFR